MHPNAFLRSFWRPEIKPQVFVAMSFDARYKNRYDNVIVPAVESVEFDGKQLSAHRVDVSKTGDSILTDILEGVAHSVVVLADVSTIGKDSVTGNAYRNGNVMYEVGLALACRHSTEILLVRDDRDRFLFDVSTIPHAQVDFTDVAAARELVKAKLEERINERQYFQDARLQMLVSSLSRDEVKLLEELAALTVEQLRGWRESGDVPSRRTVALNRLLDKGLVQALGRFKDGGPAYKLGPMGRTISAFMCSEWHIYEGQQRGPSESAL
jgi:hypothetical protein